MSNDKQDMSMPSCPRCRSSRLIQGRGIYDSESDISGFFVPRLKWWKLIPSSEVSFKSPLCACADCGLVWTDIEPNELRSLVSRHGKNADKKQLGRTHYQQPSDYTNYR